VVRSVAFSAFYSLDDAFNGADSVLNGAIIPEALNQNRLGRIRIEKMLSEQCPHRRDHHPIFVWM